MTINDVLKECMDLTIIHDRTRKDHYAELVFPTKDTNEWVKILEGCLGKMVKPPEAKAEKSHEQISGEFGGCHEGQTLFCKECDDHLIIAMFWPWSNGEHTTLKLAKANPPKKGVFSLFSKKK